MEYISKLELDKLVNEVTNVFLTGGSNLESVISKYVDDQFFTEKVRKILFFSPIYYPKNVMVSKMLHKERFFCRIKVEYYWKAEMIKKREDFYEVLKIKPIKEKINERSLKLRPSTVKTDYFGFYIDKNKIPDGVEPQEYANSLATSFLIDKIFHQYNQ